MNRIARLPPHLFDLIAGLASLALFLVLHPSVIEQFGVSFLGSARGDGGLYVWLTQLAQSDPRSALNMETNAFYPYPLSRAWSDSFLLPSTLSAILATLGLSFSASYNTTLLCALALNGYASSRLARSVGVAGVYALASGVLVANSSYLIGNIGHPQLLFFFWIPLAWSFVLPSLSTRVSPRGWLLAGACVTGAFYSGVYYAIFATLGLGIIWLCAVFWGRLSRRSLVYTLVLAGVGLSPIAVTLPAYLETQNFFGARGLYEATHFAATGISYLAFSQHNEVFGFLAKLTHGEGTLNPGFLALFFAALFGAQKLLERSRVLTCIFFGAIITVMVASSIVDRGTTSETITCVSAWIVLLTASALTLRTTHGSVPLALMLIGVLCFVFSFGPGGDPIKHEPAWAPFGALYSYVPGLGSIRAVARFGVVVVAGVIILAAAACQRWAASLRWGHSLIAFLFVGLSLLENSVPTVPIDAIAPRPKAFDVLQNKRAPHEAAIALPFAGELENGEVKHWSQLADMSVSYAQWSGSLGIPIVNGYSGQRTKLHYELPKALAEFPDERSLNQLARICGVRWVVIVPHMLPSFDLNGLLARRDLHHEHIASWERFDDGSILVRLAPYAITLSNEAEVFLAPPNTPARFTATSLNQASCSVSIESIERASAGDLTRVLLDRIEVSAPHTPLIPLPSPTASRAAPQILALTTQECAASLVCSPE